MTTHLKHTELTSFDLVGFFAAGQHESGVLYGGQEAESLVLTLKHLVNRLALRAAAMHGSHYMQTILFKVDCDTCKAQ